MATPIQLVKVDGPDAAVGRARTVRRSGRDDDPNSAGAL